VDSGKLHSFVNFVPKAFLSMPTGIYFYAIMMLGAVDSLCSALAEGGFCGICSSLIGLCHREYS
jgi:hypothetical protein